MIFAELAQQCAPAVALDLLVALAAVESGLEPLAVGIGQQGQRYEVPGRAIAAAVGAIDEGKTVSMGLLGLTGAQMAALGASLPDAFDACTNMRLAQAVVHGAQRDGDRASVSGDRAVLKAWYRPGGRFASFEVYAASVAVQRAQAGSLAKQEIRGATVSGVAKNGPVPTAPKEQPGTTSLAASRGARAREAEPGEVVERNSASQGSAADGFIVMEE